MVDRIMMITERGNFRWVSVMDARVRPSHGGKEMSVFVSRGKYEIEYAHRLKQDSPTLSKVEFILHLTNHFVNLAMDEAEAITDHIFKEHDLMLRETQPMPDAQMSSNMQHWAQHLLRTSMGMTRKSLVDLFMKQWNVGLAKATEHMDEAVRAQVNKECWPESATILPASQMRLSIPIQTDTAKITADYSSSPEAVGLEMPNANFAVGDMVSKRKGYRFPGIVVGTFLTRKKKRRYIVEGIGDGNDECLHIFSNSDLEPLKARYGWVYNSGNEEDGDIWGYANHFANICEPALDPRPATAAEQYLFRSKHAPERAAKNAVDPDAGGHHERAEDGWNDPDRNR